MIRINNINIIDPVTKEIIHTHKHKDSISHFQQKKKKNTYFYKVSSFFSTIRKYFSDFGTK